MTQETPKPQEGTPMAQKQRRPRQNHGPFCADCGGTKGDNRALRCRPCAARAWCGPGNPMWKGDKATVNSGRERARYLYERETCERCGGAATDLHHKDGNPLDNRPENIQGLCRRCHMVVDGRLEALVELSKSRAKEPQPCVNCERVVNHRRHGRCDACRVYFNRHGSERPPRLYQRRAA